MTLLARLAPPGSALHKAFLEPDPPELALEVREGGLGLVRARLEQGAPRLLAAGAVALAPGALRLSLTEPGVADAAAFGAALEALLARCGAAAGGRVCLVLPDVVGRLRLFPEAELRAASAEQSLELARFRLKKALPYDVREAKVAVSLPAPGQGDGVVAVVARSVLESYERACAAAGLWAGRVELSSVALSRALPARPEPVLLVNRDRGWASLLLLAAGWPRLVRTFDQEAVPDPAALLREVRATCAFAEERLGFRPAGVVLRDAAGEPGLAAALAGAAGVPAEALAAPPGVPAAEAPALLAAHAAFEAVA